MKTYKDKTLEAIDRLIIMYDDIRTGGICPLCNVYQPEYRIFYHNKCNGCIHKTCANFEPPFKAFGCYKSITFNKWTSSMDKNSSANRANILRKAKPLIQQLPNEVFTPTKWHKYIDHPIIKKLREMDYKLQK